MRIAWIFLIPLSLTTAASAEDVTALPDPFLDGLSIGDTSLQVEAALGENGFETGSEWYNLDSEPIYRIQGVAGNRKLIYEYDVYGRLYYLTYLEHWDSIDGCERAFGIWLDWLKMYFGEPVEGDEHYAHWSRSGYEIMLYDRSDMASESRKPTTMVNIYPLRVP